MSHHTQIQQYFCPPSAPAVTYYNYGNITNIEHMPQQAVPQGFQQQVQQLTAPAYTVAQYWHDVPSQNGGYQMPQNNGHHAAAYSTGGHPKMGKHKGIGKRFHPQKHQKRASAPHGIRRNGKDSAGATTKQQQANADDTDHQQPSAAQADQIVDLLSKLLAEFTHFSTNFAQFASSMQENWAQIQRPIKRTN
ncbi:hypothetical protein niasHT_037143 [Heterodera trifolii]|uniref:Uncharacterized protein n=1 Tax=Heterodera trifolii TaxID=157864 RepID=A0ABD2IJZ8_9BILA